jgi:membrane-bound lytic murein transglycosylase A
VRFKELLAQSNTSEEFTRRLNQEFTVYKSAGWNAKGGGVLFTAYCTPILEGSRTKDATYRYPLYKLPPDLVKAKDGAILGRRTAAGGVEPYPSRRQIEASALLAGKNLELVYLKNPLDAFIAHVNGSAVIETPTGERLKFGYAGKNGREYTSLGKELIRAKELEAKNMSLQKIREWGAKNPAKLEQFLALDESYVFFTEIDGNPRGSLNVEVQGDRTLATDKALFPRGGVVFVDTKMKNYSTPDQFFKRFMLDQDTGGAIRTAGRADIYLGVGDEAEQRAGKTMAEGQLYYLFLNENEVSRATP